MTLAVSWPIFHTANLKRLLSPLVCVLSDTGSFYWRFRPRAFISDKAFVCVLVSSRPNPSLTFFFCTANLKGLISPLFSALSDYSLFLNKAFVHVLVTSRGNIVALGVGYPFFCTASVKTSISPLLSVLTDMGHSYQTRLSGSSKAMVVCWPFFLYREP